MTSPGRNSVGHQRRFFPRSKTNVFKLFDVLLVSPLSPLFSLLFYFSSFVSLVTYRGPQHYYRRHRTLTDRIRLARSYRARETLRVSLTASSRGGRLPCVRLHSFPSRDNNGELQREKSVKKKKTFVFTNRPPKCWVVKRCRLCSFIFPSVFCGFFFFSGESHPRRGVLADL